MTNSFLQMLRCPLCGGNFEITKAISELENNLEWGVIGCDACHTRYPVAFGIPILKHPDAYVDVVNDYNSRNYTIQKNSQVKTLVKYIEEGKTEEAKRALLFTRWPRKRLKQSLKEKESFNYDNKLTRILPNTVVRFLGKRNLFYLYWLLSKLSFQDSRVIKKEEKIFQKLMQQTTAVGFIELYFQLALSTEMGLYFIHRFGTPRHLTSLSLLSVLPENEKPLLEIACGAGHIMHYFKQRNHNQPVVGMDRTFAHLYIAKKFICPEGNYFCADVEQKLPFQNDLFLGVYCSDAFPELPSREHVIAEMKRVLSDEGTMVITRVSSIPQTYYRTEAILSADQLKNLFKGMQNIVLDEDDVLSRYINKEGPDLKNERPIEDLRQKDWISIVAGYSKDIFKECGQFHSWPHALGQLQINPLYKEGGKDKAGNTVLKLEFPSAWYVNTNIEYMRYAPKSVHIDEAVIHDIKERKITPEIEALTSDFVILGMPEHFL